MYKNSLSFNSPQHFACLHVKESTLVYYDSLKSNNIRPYSEYPDQRVLIDDIGFHEPKVWQEEAEWMYGDTTLLAVIP